VGKERSKKKVSSRLKIKSQKREKKKRGIILA